MKGDACTAKLAYLQSIPAIMPTKYPVQDNIVNISSLVKINNYHKI